VKDPLNYSLLDQVILEAASFTYLGIIRMMRIEGCLGWCILFFVMCAILCDVCYFIVLYCTILSFLVL
jgi:hypothetical protein